MALEPLIIKPGLVITPDLLSFKAVRSSGPGGQNVNKVNSKVELRFAFEDCPRLTDFQKTRLREQCRNQLDAGGQLLLTSQESRDQTRNLELCRQKLKTLVLKALVVPKRRKATKPSRGAKERRLKEKRINSDKKRTRRSGYDD